MPVSPLRSCPHGTAGLRAPRCVLHRNHAPCNTVELAAPHSLHRLDNASVDGRGAVGATQPFVLELPDRPRQIGLLSTWVTPGPFIVHIVVEDDYGEWRTLV